MEVIFIVGIIFGILLGAVLWAYHTHITPKKKKEDTPSAPQVKPGDVFQRMFTDPSVWSTYDTSAVNKIYRYKDLENIDIAM